MQNAQPNKRSGEGICQLAWLKTECPTEGQPVLSNKSARALHVQHDCRVDKSSRIWVMCLLIQYGIYNTVYCFRLWRRKVSSEIRKRHSEIRKRQYVEILGKVCGDTWQSMSGYLAKYVEILDEVCWHCLMEHIYIIMYIAPPKNISSVKSTIFR